MGLPSATGALVADVTHGGPADKAGLKNGDVIIGFDGKTIPDSRTLPRVVADTGVGKTVGLEILRGGKKQMLHIQVGKLKDDGNRPVAKLTHPPKKTPLPPKLSRLGLSLGALDSDARGKYHLAADASGVLVTDVDPDSPAGPQNFRAGDVIVEVQNQPVHTPEEVMKRIDTDMKAGKKVELLLVSRGGDLTFVALRLGQG
jgi:serine protease Do